MSIPDFVYVWADENGSEVELLYRWPRPPRVEGDGRLIEVVNECLGNLGPYTSDVTYPQVEEDFETPLISTGLKKVALVIEQNLAAEFLSAAVVEGETSAKHELAALGRTPVRFEDPMEFILFSTDLDRSRRASRTAVMLAITSLEAYINHSALTCLSIWKEEERLSLLDKWVIVPRVMAGGTFDRGSEPFQSFQRLVSLRHKLIHSRGRRDRLELPDVGLGMAQALFAPSEDAALDSGREACVVAREMYLEFASLTGLECPKWVSAVPPGQSTAAADWMGATIMDGLREDPDFPRPHDHPDALPFPWAGRNVVEMTNEAENAPTTPMDSS